MWVDQIEDITRVGYDEFGRCEMNNGNDVKAGPSVGIDALLRDFFIRPPQQSWSKWN